MSFNENLYLQSLRNYLDFVKSFQEQHLRLLLLLLRCCQNGEGVFLNFQAIIMKKISKQTKYWLTPLFKKKSSRCFASPCHKCWTLFGTHGGSKSNARMPSSSSFALFGFFSFFTSFLLYLSLFLPQLFCFVFNSTLRLQQ